MVHHMTKPYLSIENVGVTFPGARSSEVLRGIDLRVDRGQFVSIIGIPFAVQHMKLATLALTPFGHTYRDVPV